MKSSIIRVTVVLLLIGCLNTDAGSIPQVAIRSIHTSIAGASCKTEIDRQDPNETPYQFCPGVAGYALTVRLVDSGRQSIDIVDSAKRVFPLNFNEVVTHHMSNLDGDAEWRVTTRKGKQVPLALLVRVQVHEDDDNPEKITGTYIVVTKITPTEACVTDSFKTGTRTEAEVRNIADSAWKRKCARRL